MTADNPYHWTRLYEGNDTLPAKYYLWRAAKVIGDVNLDRDVPFHSAILNDLCELLHRYETNQLADVG